MKGFFFLWGFGGQNQNKPLKQNPNTCDLYHSLRGHLWQVMWRINGVFETTFLGQQHQVCSLKIYTYFPLIYSCGHLLFRQTLLWALGIHQCVSQQIIKKKMISGKENKKAALCKTTDEWLWPGCPEKVPDRLNQKDNEPATQENPRKAAASGVHTSRYQLLCENTAHQVQFSEIHHSLLQVYSTIQPWFF